jgi:hypothetical protein
MDATENLEAVRDLWLRAEAVMADAPGLALTGMIIAVLAIAYVLLRLGRMALRIFGAARRAGVAVRVRASKDVGARILVARGGGGRRGAIGACLKGSLHAYLKDYMFGGLFNVVDYPGAVEREEDAQALLRRSEADVVIWSEMPAGTRGVARILSRPLTESDPPRTPATIIMPRQRSAWSEPLKRALAYAVAKQHRPALGRPQDFRPERLQPVVESLLSILSQKPAADPRLIAELEDDSTSGALQLAVSGDAEWLDRAIELSRAIAAVVTRSAAPERWIHNKINLGRALRLKAEKQFDPVMIRESISHLQEALDALRSEPRLKLAEAAAQAIADGQRMLGARRKFSITGGGI